MFKLIKHFDKTLAKKVQTPNFPQHIHLIHMQLSDLKPHKLHKQRERNQITRIPSQTWGCKATRTEQYQNKVNKQTTPF